MELLKYEGYVLYDWGHGYRSEIDGRWLTFDTASQWKQFIDYRDGKRSKKGNRS